MAQKKKEAEEKAKKAAAESSEWSEGMPSNKFAQSKSLSNYSKDQLEDIINEWERKLFMTYLREKIIK